MALSKVPSGKFGCVGTRAPTSTTSWPVTSKAGLLLIIRKII
jgi:hypothetical protein